MAVLTFEDLYKAVSRFLGTGDSPSGDDLTHVKDLANRGYRRALAERDWSFLSIAASLTTVSGTYKYWLPSDFNRVIGGRVSFSLGEVYSDIVERSYQQIVAMRAACNSTTQPQFFAVIAGDYNTSVGTRYQLSFYPTPDDAYTLHYEYIFDPPLLVNTDDIPAGFGDFSQAILQCCLAEAESAEDEAAGPQEAKAQRALIMASGKDAKRVPGSLGYNGSGGFVSSSPDRDLHLIQNDVEVDF